MNESDSNRVESIVDEALGSGIAVVDPHRAGSGEVRLDPVAGEASVRAVGQWSDDEDPTVTVSFSVGSGHVDITMSTDEAQRFAADLRSAATQAVQGANELKEGTE